jgi:hypothetical protein
MTRTSLLVVAELVVAGMLVGSGCSSVKPYAPATKELASLCPKGNVVIFPVRVLMPGVVEGPEQAEATKYVAENAQTLLEEAFAKAGYGITPWASVDQMRRSAGFNAFGEENVRFLSVLYSHLGVDCAVYCTVRVRVREAQHAREVVELHIYSARDGTLLNSYRWLREAPAGPEEGAPEELQPSPLPATAPPPAVPEGRGSAPTPGAQ